MAENEVVALDWDDDYEDNGGSFILLDEGIYPFTVEAIDKERYQGSDKIPACPRANITLAIEMPDGRTARVFDSILLISSMQWKINRFFEGLGFTKEADPNNADREIMRPHWNEAIGKAGQVRIKQRTYTNNKGEERTTNDVDEYINPTDFERVLGAGEQPNKWSM